MSYTVRAIWAAFYVPYYKFTHGGLLIDTFSGHKIISRIWAEQVFPSWHGSWFYEMYIALTNAIWCSLASRLIILGNSVIQGNKLEQFYRNKL